MKYKEDQYLQFFSGYFPYSIYFQYEFKTRTNNIELRQGECLGHRKQFNYIELLINNKAENPQWIDIRKLKPVLNNIKSIKKVWKKMSEDDKLIIMHTDNMNLKNIWQEPFFIIEILLKYHIDVYDLFGKGIAIKK